MNTKKQITSVTTAQLAESDVQPERPTGESATNGGSATASMAPNFCSGSKALVAFEGGENQYVAIASTQKCLRAHGYAGSFVMVPCDPGQPLALAKALGELPNGGSGMCVFPIVNCSELDWDKSGMIAIGGLSGAAFTTDATIIYLVSCENKQDVSKANALARLCGLKLLDGFEMSKGNLESLEPLIPIEAISKMGTTPDPVVAGLALYLPSGKEPGQGLVVGRTPDGGHLCAPRREHSLTIGMTGSGKTLSSVVPTIILNAKCKGDRPNMVVVDCKPDTYDQTACVLADEGYVVHRIDLSGDTTPDCWNPIESMVKAVRGGDYSLADMLWAPISEAAIRAVHSINDVYWETAAAELAKNIIVCAAQTYPAEVDVTLGMICDIVRDEERLKIMITGAKGVASEALAKNIKLAPKTLSCVIDVVMKMFATFNSPAGRLVCSKSTFEPEDLITMRVRKPVVLYLTCPDTSSANYRIATMFVSSLYNRYVAKFDATEPSKRSKLRDVQVIWDEYARFPRLDCMTSIMAAGRSRAFFTHLFLQSLSQLTEAGMYTEPEARTLVEQMPTVVFMRSSGDATDRELARRTHNRVTSAYAMDLGQAWVCRFGRPAFYACSPVVHSMEELVENGERSRGLLKLHHDVSRYLAMEEPVKAAPKEIYKEVLEKVRQQKVVRDRDAELARHVDRSLSAMFAD